MSPHDLFHYRKPQTMMTGRTRPPVISLGNRSIIGRHLTALALSAYFRDQPERFRNVDQVIGTLQAPTLLEDFRAFLETHRRELANDASAVLMSTDLARIPVWEDSSKPLGGEESRLVRARRSRRLCCHRGLEACGRRRGGHWPVQVGCGPEENHSFGTGTAVSVQAGGHSQVWIPTWYGTVAV